MKIQKISKTNLMLYSIPVFITISLLVTYLVNSEFYLKYILSGLNREAQVVENLTFFPVLLSAFIFWKGAYKIKNISEYRYSFFLFIIIGLAAFFFAGEEISWGQSFFFWKTPEFYATKSVETNLHNSPIPVKSFGNIFLLCLFVLLPILHKKKKDNYLFKSLSLAIPPGPVIFCVLYSFFWKLIKSSYRVIYSKEALKTSTFYMEFAEQSNEHKEMLVAIAFFIYACFVDYKINNLLKKQ